MGIVCKSPSGRACAEPGTRSTRRSGAATCRGATTSTSGSDGIHFNIRLEEDRLCTLAVIGVRADGTKELLALEDGYRESEENWASVLRDLRGRGLRARPTGGAPALDPTDERRLETEPRRRVRHRQRAKAAGNSYPHPPTATAPVVDSTVLSRTLARRRFTTTLLALFGVAALILAGLGIYGVIAVATAQRTREIGLRIAIGARPRHVVWMVAPDVVGLAAAGSRSNCSRRCCSRRPSRACSTTRRHAVRLHDAGRSVGAAARGRRAAALSRARRASSVDPLLALRTE